MAGMGAELLAGAGRNWNSRFSNAIVFLTESASDAKANKAGATLSAAVEARGSPLWRAERAAMEGTKHGASQYLFNAFGQSGDVKWLANDVERIDLLAFAQLRVASHESTRSAGRSPRSVAQAPCHPCQA